MVDTPENINSEAQQQETGNREIDALNTMLRNGESAENINNSLNANFLENLKNGLHPDTAKQLRDAIKWINWYDAPNSNLKQLYDYVVSICDAFDTTGKENDEHEGITDSLTMNDVLDQRFKQLYLDRINFVECISAVAQDGSVSDNFLSAIKGVLNWEKISWGFLVKMAEFLGIDTKRDNRYWSRRIKNLWEKVFSMTDEKWLFAKLWKMYEHMDTNTNVVNFRNNSFEGRSLNDICNLLKINWNWDDINKTDPKVTLFCRSLKLNSETFAQQFNAKNLDRKNTNTEALNNFSILSLLDPNKAITKTETEWTYKYGEVEFTQANFLTQLGITPDTIKTNLEGAWAVFAWSELENAISSKQNERFNKIVENAGEAPEALPDHITAEDINKTKMRWRTPVKPDDVVTEINTAIDWIAAITAEAKKGEIITRITNVISALKEPWEQSQTDKSQPNIRELQNKIKDAGQSVIVDWKFWPNTFGAMKNYINAETISVNPDEPNDADSGNPEGDGDSVEAEIVDYKKEALNLLKDDLVLPGKEQIKSLLNSNSWIRYIQLSLLPVYKWKIDWKLWPKTLSALKTYIDLHSNESGNLMLNLSDTNHENVVNLSTWNLPGCLVALKNWDHRYMINFHNWAEAEWKVEWSASWVIKKLKLKYKESNWKVHYLSMYNSPKMIFTYNEESDRARDFSGKQATESNTENIQRKQWGTLLQKIDKFE